MQPRLPTHSVLVFIALLAFAFTACSSDDDSSSSGSGSGSSSSSSDSGSDPSDDPKPIVYTEDDTKITVLLEHVFIVDLPATPSTGYEWTAETNSMLQQMTTEQIKGGSQPGAEGTQRITFRSMDVGTTTLVLNYARSFDQGVPPAKTKSFAVTVGNS